MKKLSSTEKAQRAVLPLRTAVYHSARDMPGGIAGTAVALGLNANTFQNKVTLNPGTAHVLSITELESLLNYSRDPRLMDSICAAFGDAAWLDLGGMSGGDAALISSLGDMAGKVGDMTRNVAEALADGRVEISELAVLEKSANELHRSVHTVLARARAMAEGSVNGRD